MQEPDAKINLKVISTNLLKHLKLYLLITSANCGGFFLCYYLPLFLFFGYSLATMRNVI